MFFTNILFFSSRVFEDKLCNSRSHLSRFYLSKDLSTVSIYKRERRSYIHIIAFIIAVCLINYCYIKLYYKSRRKRLRSARPGVNLILDHTNDVE